jgi:peptide/nickel transport system permease protein
MRGRTGQNGRVRRTGDRPWHIALGVSLLLVGATLVAALASVAVEIPRSLPFQSPSWDHPLGTDDLGWDLLSLLVRSAPISLLIGLGAGVVAVVIGTAMGLVAGYGRGAGGELFSGVIDVVLLIPMLPFMLLLVATLGPSMENIILAVALLGWCPTARAVRARVLQLREAPFVEALTALGLTRARILVRHVLPNVSEIVSAKFVLSIAGAMLSEAALSFMGFGDPIRPSWGRMMHHAFQRGGFANGLWNWYLPPGLCISACALGFILLGLWWEKRSEIKTSVEWEV